MWTMFRFESGLQVPTSEEPALATPPLHQPLRHITPREVFAMSIHRSLKIKSSLLRSRNVWTRIERLEALKRAGEWDDQKTVYGLRKVRTGSKAAKKA